MKFVKPLLALGLLAAALGGSNAWADHYHGRVGVGVVIGGPGYWGYPSPYYYPPYPPYPYSYAPVAPVVVAPAAPPVYIEQGQPQQSEQQPTNDWFYCRKPDGYYPYVKECPGGWQRVAPHPPSER